MNGPRNTPLQVLAGGGELGALMRETDWASTPLGPVEDWPQSLRTAVSILLNSRFGMYIAWGPEYLQIYNDCYRPILGSTKHPAALGNRASTTFAESWDIIGPMFEEVRRGNATGSEDWMLPLDRHGFLEECFFTFSYSPIHDESGGVGGVHVTVTETTPGVLSARRLRTLHQLGQSILGKRSAAEACSVAAAALTDASADLPFALFYTLSDDGRVARLAGCVGMAAGDLAAPLVVSLDAVGAWPLGEALHAGRIHIVERIPEAFGVIASRAWPERVVGAAVVPIRRGNDAQIYGLLVAGISPRLRLDPAYELFLSSVASHVASAIADSRAFEEEQRLVNSERQRLYAHFQQAPFAVAVLRGTDFVVELANSAALAVWGKTPALVGQPLLEGFPELVGQPFVDYLKDVVRTGIAYEGKGSLARMPRGPNGELVDVYFNFVYSPLRGGTEAVEGVLVAGFEVTAEVQARRHIEEAQRLFKSVVDNVPELAWTARPDGYIDFYNQRWYEYTGKKPAEMEGWGWRAVHDPALVDAVIAQWEKSLAEGIPFEMEFPLRGADGSYQWFLTRVRPLRDAEDTIVRWFGTNTNINERVRLLASEKAAREEAERSNRAKDEFVAIVSHELRNPLNAMLGWTRLLRSGALPPERAGRALETIERNAVTQAQLIDDLLDVARIASGKLPLEVQSVRLARVIEAALDSARPAIEAKSLKVHVLLDSGDLLAGDPARLQQVVWNLLTNATKFTPRDGWIRIVLRRDSSHLELSVSDSGAGIDAAFLPHVFQRFRQADASTTKAHGGLGLGLAITKNLVEMHGGTITVESKGLGKGSTFVVRLPVATVRESTATTFGSRAAHSAVPMEIDAPSELRGLRVLVVDDEPDGCEIVAAILASCGASVVTAESVAQAMEAFAQQVPDVILSDIGMPEEDGYALMKRIRELPRERGGATPAACLTGYASVEDRRRALLAGFTMHLPKPIDPLELVAVVASLARMASAIRSVTT
jgi:PAS domain S-box-containing protein